MSKVEALTVTGYSVQPTGDGYWTVAYQTEEGIMPTQRWASPPHPWPVGTRLVLAGPEHPREGWNYWEGDTKNRSY